MSAPPQKQSSKNPDLERLRREVADQEERLQSLVESNKLRTRLLDLERCETTLDEGSRPPEECSPAFTLESIAVYDNCADLIGN